MFFVIKICRRYLQLSRHRRLGSPPTLFYFLESRIALTGYGFGSSCFISLYRGSVAFLRSSIFLQVSSVIHCFLRVRSSLKLFSPVVTKAFLMVLH